MTNTPEEIEKCIAQARDACKKAEQVAQQVQDEWDKYNNGVFCSLTQDTIEFVIMMTEKARKEERERIAKKIRTMYKPAGFGELSSAVFYRMGYNLAIDDVIVHITSPLPPVHTGNDCQPAREGQVEPQTQSCRT
jgi:hypothetical protein